MRITFILLILLSLGSCKQKKHQASNWELVYKNNAKGEKIFGDKETLMNAVRRGYPVRIGFGGRRTTDTLKSIEHFADAEFLTIVNGKEVFAQINSIYGQRPNLEADTLRIAVKHENMWTLIIGTNGERSTLSRHFDEEQTKESQQGNRSCNWYVNMPDDMNEGQTMPIWD